MHKEHWENLNTNVGVESVNLFINEWLNPVHVFHLFKWVLDSEMTANFTANSPFQDRSN